MINGSKVRYMPKDAWETMTPIIRLLKLFSLTSLTREKKRLKITSLARRIFTIATVIAITILFSTLKILWYQAKDDATNIKFTDSLQVTYLVEFIQYIVDLTYVFKFGGYTSLKYFELYKRIDEILGMTYNSIIKKKVWILTVSVCLLGAVSAVLDFEAWAIFKGYIEHALFSIEYLFFFINTLTVIDMCANVSQIEFRLKTIGDILQDLYSSTINSIGVVDVVGDKSWLYFSKDKEKTRKIMGSSKFLEYNNLNDIVWLNKCYLFLIEQNNYINEVYGARILLNNSSQLYNMVNFINLAIRIITGVIFAEGTLDKLFFLSLTCILRTICSAVNVACLVYHCEKSYKQRATIISISDHILVDKNISESMRRTLAEFRSLVDTRPIEFTAMNFYRLDYDLLVSSASVVTTLTVIMLQNMQ